MEEIPQDFVVPHEASARGSIMVGELKSDSATFPDMLVQFSKLHPYTRKAKIYLYPRVEQAKQIFTVRPPFSFRGDTRHGEFDETWTAQGIWTKSGSRIGHSPTFWSAPFGEIELLEITSVAKGSPQALPSNAWFAANQCFVLQILANPDEEDLENSKKYGFESRVPFYLKVSDGATTEINRRLRANRTKGLKEISKDGYSVTIRDYKDLETVREDAEALMILASLGSDENTMFWHWTSSSGEGHMKRSWRFNSKKSPKLNSRHNPLLSRDSDAVRRFMETAFPIYRPALHKPLFDSAVYALTTKNISLETRIARLFAGIQGALQFALQEPRGTSRPTMRVLLKKFDQKFGDHLTDIWPLLRDPKGGSSLSDLRNAIVHGDTFSEEDFIALSYASDNLTWTLQRILLLALNWKIDESYASPQSLRNYYSYQWQTVQQGLKL